MAGNWPHLLPAGLRQARILPIPFAVREMNYGGSEHNTNVLTVLTFKDAKSIAEREQFAEFLASIPTPLSDRAWPWSSRLP